MNCDEFLEWMKTHTPRGIPEAPEVATHLRTCPACRQIYSLDLCLEAGIQQAFTPHRLPAGLAESIDACMDRYADIRQKSAPTGTSPLPSPVTKPPEPRKTPPDKKEVTDLFQKRPRH